MIATKGLKAKGFFRNLRMSTRKEKKEKKRKTLLPRVPLVAISTQKVCIWH